MSEIFYERPSHSELLMNAARKYRKYAEETLVATANDVLDKYMQNDVQATEGVYQNVKNTIVDVIFNDPATIVFWGDGTKTVVKAEGESFDPEKGLAMAIAKHCFGNNWRYYNVFKHWLRKGARYDYKADKKGEEETK